jgi:integrase
MGLRREWLRLDESRIIFPRSEMKTKNAKLGDFVLPLSAAAVEIVREALAAGDVLHPGSPWVFPTRDQEGTVIATKVVREKAKALENATGHALRHTWKTAARNARLPEVSIEVLLDHSQPKMAGAYGSLAEQFDRFLADQEIVTAYILSKVTK